MISYGILRSETNTGEAGELIATFAAPLEIKSNKPNFQSDTLTLKRQTVYTDIQRWEIRAGLVPLVDSSEMFVHSVINGYTEKFFIRMPQIYRSTNISEDYDVRVSTNVAGGQDTLRVSGLFNDKLPVGEFIKFRGHSKVYMIKASTRVALNLNEIRISPRLVNEIEQSEVLSYGSKVTMATLYDNDSNIGVSYTDGVLARYDSISMIEAL